MRRALGTIGLVYFVVQLLAAFLPPAAFWPLAAIFVLFGAAALAFLRGAARAYTSAVLLTCAAALMLRMGYLAVVAAPVRALGGQEHELTATVLSARRGYLEDTVYAEVRVEERDGQKANFRTQIEALPSVEPGEKFAARVLLEPVAADELRLSNYAKGVYVSARYKAGFVSLGENRALYAWLVRARNGLGARLRALLPGKYGVVAAAMSLGEKSLLTEDMKEPFRRAGLSHLLVVSGLHLSLMSGAAFVGFRKFLMLRESAAAATVATLAMMALIGFTPSVVRSGTVVLMYYIGRVIGKGEDTFTDLALSALLLCLQNPYAAVDTGLLLSYSATMGVLWTVAAGQKYRLAHHMPGYTRYRIRRAIETALLPIPATLATLPVLITIGGGVSLLSIVGNLLCVPPASAVVVLGMCTALLDCVPPLRFLSRLLGLVCGLLLRWLFFVTDKIADVRGAFVHVTGIYAMCIAFALCGLAYAAWRANFSLPRAVAVCAAFVTFSAVIYAVEDRDVAYLTMAGTGSNPALIVTQGMRTAVLFRGADANASEVKQYLEQRNRTQTDLLVDLRRPDGDRAQAEAATGELARQLGAKQTVCAYNLTNNTVLYPFHDIIIYIKHQAEGNFACVDVGGRRFGVAQGKADFSAYPPLDVFFGGSGEPSGLQCSVLALPAGGYIPWADSFDAARVWRGPRTPEIAVRAGGAFRLKEVTDDFE